MNISTLQELSKQNPLTSHLMLDSHTLQLFVHLYSTHAVVLSNLGDGHVGITLQDFVVVAYLRQHIGNLVAQFHVLFADSEDGFLLLLVLQG